MVRALHDGEDWTESLVATDVVMVPRGLLSALPDRCRDPARGGGGPWISARSSFGTSRPTTPPACRSSVSGST